MEHCDLCSWNTKLVPFLFHPFQFSTMFTQDQIAEILAKSAGGSSTREIAAWLEAAHGIKTSHAKVGRIIREHRDERADAIRSKVVEALEPHVTSDLDLLSKWQRKLDKIADRLLSEDSDEDAPAIDHDVLLKTVDQLRKITETKLKCAGATEQRTVTSGGLLDFLALAHESDDSLDQSATSGFGETTR